MLGLALDSAGLLASATLWTGSVEGKGLSNHDEAITSLSPPDILAYQALSPKAGKADQLILVVEQLLEACGRQYRDLDVIAINRGPGSFTGIRSAVALGRSLALATGCPVIGVTSHEAFAASLGPDAVDDLNDRPWRLMIALDARRGQVYLQGFDPDLNSLGEPRAKKPDVAAQELLEGRWRLGGSGAALVRAYLDETADVIMLDDINLDAKGVAIAANARLAGGEVPKPGFDLLPLYIRPPDAVRPAPLVTPSPQPAEDQA